MPTTDITFPKKTNAGSSFQFIVDELTELVVKLEKSRSLLVNAAPHPRDYIYNEGNGALAQEQHRQHLETLDKLIEFYTSKRDHCFDELNRK